MHKDIKAIQDKMLRAAPKVYEELIIRQMEKGKSPVEGGRWDKPYSKSYRDAIKKDSTGLFSAFGKRAKPVNLKLTGTLHESLSTRIFNNSITIEFDDPLADVHNRRGTRYKKRIRRMLPTESGESFNKVIRTAIDLLLRRIVRNTIR